MPTPPTCTIWIDFEDIFVHLETRTRPSGIQRLAFEAAREMLAAAPGRVRFVRQVRGGSGFREVDFELARAAFARSTGASAVAPRVLRGIVPPSDMPMPPGPLRHVWRRLGGMLSGEVRHAVLQVLTHQWQALTALPGVGRAVMRSLRRRRAAIDTGDSYLPVRMQAGDVLLALAAPWGTGHAERAAAARAERGVRYGVLFYDLIPLCRPEFCVPAHAERFREFVDAVLPVCDVPMAISHATRRDLEAHAAHAGIALRAPVAVVRVGTSFTIAEAAETAAAPLLPAGSYVLFVSTIEARKNHTLLFRAWRRLLEEMPAGQVPTLVFAGGIGWMVDDLLQQFANSRFLDGHMAIVESPSDAVLESLYRGAMFTVYPSHYEGWGLPVVESLALGTPCVAARATSLPEAGGTLARYFAPDDVGAACRVIRDLIENPDDLAAWRAEVRAAFRPTAWRETAREILAAVDAVIVAPPPQAPCGVDADGTAV